MKFLKMLSILLLFYVNIIPLPVDLKADRPFLVREESTARQKTLENLKEELKSAESKLKEFTDQTTKKIDDLKKQAEQLKKDSSHSKNENIAKKVVFLDKQRQVLIDTIEVKKQIVETLKQHVEFWEKYFSNSGKGIERIEDKSLYAFSDLQNITKKIAIEDDQRLRLLGKKEEEEGIVHSQELQISLKERDVKQIEKNIEDLKKKPDESDIKSEVDVLDVEKEVTQKERELAEYRVDLHQKESDLLDSRITIEQEKLKLLREDLAKVRGKIYIDNAEIAEYEHKNNDVKKEITSKKVKLLEQKNSLLTEKTAAKDKLELLSNRYRISLGNIRQIEDWEIDADSLVSAYGAYLVSFEQTKLTSIDRLLTKNKAEQLILDAKSEQAQALYNTVKSLYDITQGHFKDGDSLDKERAALKDQKQTLLAEIKKYKGEVATAHGFIKDQHRAVTNLKHQQEKIKTLSTKVAAHQKKHEEAVQILNLAMQKLDNQKEVTLKISELYTQLIDIKEEILETLNFLLQEIDAIGVWHRATHAMTWDRIKNILPNIKMFIQGVYSTIVSFITSYNMRDVAYKISQLSFGQVFLFFLFLFFAFVLFVVLQALLPSLYRSLMSEEEIFVLSRFIAVFIGFCIDVFRPLYFWVFFLLFSSMYELPIAVMLIFFSYSIFFWVYASRVFLRKFLDINSKSNFMLLHERLVERFSFIFSFFSISTVLILFIRRMFMLVMTYQHSDFPNILLRMYHVVIFISIVFSIDKEELLQLLPQKTKFGEKVALVLQEYYYLFLTGILGILVMSDPYLGGYGSLMWSIFWNSLFTAIVFVVLFMLHNMIREYSVRFFFKEDDISGSSVENFENAKTWYAFYVIGLFLCFTLIGSIIFANIWGYGVNYDTIQQFLSYKLFEIGSTDKIIPMTVLKLFKMIGFIFLGFIVAYLFKHFVLQRVFEMHYVDPGVQNTVTIISRYVILFIMTMIAFANADLKFLVEYILIFGIVAFVYTFKDLFTDMVAYFFILVQRPVKLGDFVKLDSHTMGVVRKISPRAVVLRRKNAVNIVVPNSTVLKASLYNWNYTRNYIGFEDILFSVPFDTNVIKVKDILLKVVDENPDVLKVPQPIVRLNDFGDKGYIFMVRGFLSAGNTLRQWDITSDIRFKIVEMLGKEGIKVAAPSLHVLLQNQIKKEDLLNQN